MQQDDMSHVVRRRFVLRHQMDLLRTHLEDRIEQQHESGGTACTC